MRLQKQVRLKADTTYSQHHRDLHLVSNLCGDRFGLVDLAVAPLTDQARIRIRVAPYRSCREHPRLHQDLRIFDRHVVQERLALTRELLHDMHLVGVEEAAAPDPGGVDERNGVEHESVALPAS